MKQNHAQGVEGSLWSDNVLAQVLIEIVAIVKLEVEVLMQLRSEVELLLTLEPVTDVLLELHFKMVDDLPRLYDVGGAKIEEIGGFEGVQHIKGEAEQLLFCHCDPVLMAKLE